MISAVHGDDCHVAFWDISTIPKQGRTNGVKHIAFFGCCFTIWSSLIAAIPFVRLRLGIAVYGKQQCCATAAVVASSCSSVVIVVLICHTDSPPTTAARTTAVALITTNFNNKGSSTTNKNNNSNTSSNDKNNAQQYCYCRLMLLLCVGPR